MQPGAAATRPGLSLVPARLPYVAAVLLTAAAIFLRLLLDPVLGSQAPYLVLLIAPVAAAAYGGFAPGVFATAVAALAGQWLFVPPMGSPIPPNPAEWVRVAFFVVEGSLFGWLFEVRRRALLEANRRERWFADALESAPSGMIVADRTGRITFANARAREWFGYCKDEFRSLTVEHLVPPALRGAHALVRESFAAAPAPRAMGAGRELHARRKDGTEFPVEIGLSPVDTGGQRYVLAAIVDISARRAEERAREHALSELAGSERRERFLLRLTVQLQSLRDPGEMMLAAARALGEYLQAAQVGYGEIDAEQQHVIVDRDWNDGRIPSVVGKWRMDDFGPPFIREMKAGRSVAITDVRTDLRTNTDDVIRAYESIATRSILDAPLIRDGRMVSMIFVHHPEPREWSREDAWLTEETCARVWTAVERVRAEQRARVSLELLDRAGAAARVGAFRHTLAGPDGSQWSARMYEILGVSRDDAKPLRVAAREAFAPAVAAILRQALDEMMKSGTPLEIELPLLPRPGAAEWVRLYVVPTMRDGRCVEISGAAQDISDRKRLELEIVNATNRERERIGADLHDDLGQILTGVAMQVGAFRRSLGRTDAGMQQQNVEQIERNLAKAQQACRSLARTYVAPVSAQSFVAMLEQLAADASTGSHRCRVHAQELPASTPAAMTQELYRIAQEAVNNALKHARCSEIAIEVAAGPEHLTLAVQDDGVGIGSDSSGGVGLGSMRSRAARIGGILTITSPPGGGTRVEVHCVRADAVASPG